MFYRPLYQVSEDKELMMAVHMVENYILRYDLDKERPWFIFHYKVGGSWKNVNWFPPKENAVYLSDASRRGQFSSGFKIKGQSA